MSARLRSLLEALGKRISTRSGCWQKAVPCACGTVPDHQLVAPREHPHLPGRSSSDALSDSLP